MSRFDRVFESAVGSTLRPGAPGTARLARDWGDRLVSVRYRYSETPPTRFTTVEFVVTEAERKPSPSRRVLGGTTGRLPWASPTGSRFSFPTPRTRRQSLRSFLLATES